MRSKDTIVDQFEEQLRSGSGDRLKPNLDESERFVGRANGESHELDSVQPAVEESIYTDGQCRYTLLCNEQGGCRDDVIVNRLSDDEYLMVCNAANRLKLLDHFAAVKGDSVFKLRDETLTTEMIAIQGPKVLELMGPYSRDLAALKRFRLIQFNVLTLGMIIARTATKPESTINVSSRSRNTAGCLIRSGPFQNRTRASHAFGDANVLAKVFEVQAADHRAGHVWVVEYEPDRILRVQVTRSQRLLNQNGHASLGGLGDHGFERRIVLIVIHHESVGPR